MKRVIFTFFTALALVSAGELSLSGNTFLETSVETEKSKTYLENWTLVNALKDNWEFGLQYEMHLPPQSFSYDTTGQGIYQRFIRYTENDWQLTLGNFYGSIGRGLILSAHENHDLRWDTNIDGLKFHYQNNWLELLSMSGRIRSLSGDRMNPLYSGSVTIYPFSFFNGGGGIVNSHTATQGEQTLSTAYGQILLPFGDLYGEVAYRNMLPRYEDGSACYLNANLYWRQWAVSGEYKHYEHFEIYDGVIYNYPPTAIKEHQFALPGRHQRVITPNNEEGYLLEISRTLGPLYVTANYNTAANLDGLKVWNEVMFQIEGSKPFPLDWTLLGDQQEDLEARYLNGAAMLGIPLGEALSFKSTVEHQHVTILLNERMYWSQIMMAGISHRSGWTLTWIYEHSTDQLSDKKHWSGLQADVHVLERFDLSLFTGSRRAGKVCAGGVCVIKPEFTGLEMRLIGNF